MSTEDNKCTIIIEAHKDCESRIGVLYIKIDNKYIPLKLSYDVATFTAYFYMSENAHCYTWNYTDAVIGNNYKFIYIDNCSNKYKFNIYCNRKINEVTIRLEENYKTLNVKYFSSVSHA